MSIDSLRPHGPKLNHKRGYAAAAKEQRRKDADERHAKYAALPLEQKLAGAGTKEKAKLLAKKEKKNEKSS
jgi:hypothetical protein